MRPTLSLFLIAYLATTAGADSKKLVSIEDLYRADAPTSVAVSPNGGAVAYVRRWVDAEQRRMRQSLWFATGGRENARPLEQGQPDARHPFFSPDGKWIVFTSTRSLSDGSPLFDPVPPYSDPATDIWLMPSSGGRAIPLGGRDKPYGRVFTDRFYGHISFSPDSKRLMFVADDGQDPRTPAEIANNVRIVREDQGEGYEGYGTAQVWIAHLADQPGEVAAAKFLRVTNDEFWYGDPQWWPDGRSVVVHANRTADRESVRYSINKDYDLWRIHLSDGQLERLTSGPGPQVSPRLSPDGSKLVCLSIPRKGSHADVFNLVTLELGAGGHSTQVLFDHHGSTTGDPPHLPASFPLPRDCWLSNSEFYFNAADRTSSRRQILDLQQGIEALEEESPTARSDVHARLAAARGKLTPPGNSYLRDRIVAQGQVVRWASFDGLEIEGVFTPPTHPQASPPYPLILYPHGGPHSRSTRGFNFTVQVFAANGYAVFQPNFRGTAGYGQAFINADRFDLGGADMKDILTGIDSLVERGLVDARRQFVYGVSYGGFTTCSLIGQTNQFRAAAPQNAVTDLVAMWALSDLQSWTEWEFGGKPWEVPQAMREHSPLTYAANVRTPTLILHATGDRRCPLPMGRMYYRALKSAGVETQLVLYPDEGHPIRQLPHQEDVLRRVLAWFSRHDIQVK